MKKTIVITGGVRGIGLAIAKTFLEKEYRVIVTYSQDEKNAERAREMGIEAYRVDVQNEEQMAQFFGGVGRVDVLVNNAGISLIKQIQDTSKAEWDNLFSVNVGGAFLCSREAVKGMISRQSGVIVNIASVWGEVGASCEVAYSASKAALIGFTKALAKEVGCSGVRVNCISPGVIDTQMNAHFSDDEMALLKEEIPCGRMGTGEEIASAVAFLVENEYVNGVNLSVNGGFSII